MELHLTIDFDNLPANSITEINFENGNATDGDQTIVHEADQKKGGANKSLQVIISEIKGAGDFTKSLSIFFKYILDPAYGPQIFLNGIKNWATEDNPFLPDAVNFGRKIASWGHAAENFGNNDDLRHVIGTFLLAANNGPTWAKTITDANEVFGLVRFDIPNIGSRTSGNSQWAFELTDFYNNAIGLMLWYTYDANMKINGKGN